MKKKILDIKEEKLRIEKLDTWELENDRALGRICSPLDFKYMEQVRRFNTAYEVWTYLDSLQ